MDPPKKHSRFAQKDPLPTALHDLRDVGRDLFGHKGATAARTLVVEEDAVAGKPRDDLKRPFDNPMTDPWCWYIW